MNEGASAAAPYTLFHFERPWPADLAQSMHQEHLELLASRMAAACFLPSDRSEPGVVGLVKRSRDHELTMHVSTVAADLVVKTMAVKDCCMRGHVANGRHDLAFLELQLHRLRGLQ